jgi:TonB family protein
VDVTAITSRDDFLLDLGHALGGQAGVRPVDTLDAALEAMANPRRGHVLVIDARELANVRSAVEAVHTRVPRAVVLVFAEGAAEQQLGAALKGTRVFAVLPTAIDARKTQAVFEGALAEALAVKEKARSEGQLPEPLAYGALRPQPAPASLPESRDPSGKTRLIAAAAAAAVVAAGGLWFFSRGTSETGTPAAPAPAAPSAQSAADHAAAPAATTSLVQGKVDELLEKARLAMHERRYTEPASDNALLYYRSALAVSAGNPEARDGLQRVAGVLATRFEEAMNGARLEEASTTLASFKSAAPADARLAGFEQRLHGSEVSKALADGNLDRAAALVRQAQQSGNLSAEQITRWGREISRRQEDAKVQRLAGLAEDRIRDGRLTDGDDSAKSYVQQLQASAPTNANTQRAAHDLAAAYLHKAREAALAKNTAEQERWLNEAHGAGVKPADIAAFQRELASARQKAAQAESEHVLQLARAALRDGRLTEPAQDSAAGYLTQLQSAEPTNAALADASHDLAGKLLDRARAAVLSGKSGDADLAQAKRWGADPKELLAVQQLQSSGKSKGGAVSSAAALAGSLKRVRATPPDYPTSALTQRISGSVLLEYTVDTSGEPRDVHVVEATPPGVFDQAAVNAVRRWRYAPLIVNGSPVEVPVKTRVRFELPK